MKLTYKISKDKSAITINNKYIIYTDTGVIYFAPSYVSYNKDFPEYVFQIGVKKL